MLTELWTEAQLELTAGVHVVSHFQACCKTMSVCEAIETELCCSLTELSKSHWPDDIVALEELAYSPSRQSLASCACLNVFLLRCDAERSSRGVCFTASRSRAVLMSRAEPVTSRNCGGAKTCHLQGQPTTRTTATLVCLRSQWSSSLRLILSPSDSLVCNLYLPQVRLVR